VAVLASRQLFDLWRDSDWEAIRAAVLGASLASASTPTTPSEPDAGTVPLGESEAQAGPRRRWSRRQIN